MDRAPHVKIQWELHDVTVPENGKLAILCITQSPYEDKIVKLWQNLPTAGRVFDNCIDGITYYCNGTVLRSAISKLVDRTQKTKLLEEGKMKPVYLKPRTDYT